MNIEMIHLNLIVAWLLVFLGFASGMYLGLNFHKKDWLGGYSGLQRRLYRLCHISFFGMAMVNLMFYFTARTLPGGTLPLKVASFGFLIGAVAMPLCCLVMAHFPQSRLLFAVPVISLLIAGGSMLWEVVAL